MGPCRLCLVWLLRLEIVAGAAPTWGCSWATREQLLDGVAHLEARQGAFFPPSNGTPLRIDEPLLEDVVEDVLEVEEVRGVANVDELRGHLFSCARRLVVHERSDEVGVLVGEESVEYVDDAS